MLGPYLKYLDIHVIQKNVHFSFYPAGNFTDIDVCMCPTNNYTGGRCQPGTYCPSGSAAPVLCIGGQYCEDYELALPNGECDPGYYCPAGQSERDPAPFVCWAGYYCEQGSPNPTPCPNGTFSNTTGKLMQMNRRYNFAPFCSIYNVNNHVP